ncbi:hypothetical protein HJC23_001224 [Cyclotella cryptica]|uniref:HMG box domain-containing protein n=1 Tax=Cyclotella cryptica TaxID=29204 RepID=A0ABD3QN49_9STRA|eukprot:CCRYP_003883-RA/>CCRYP_003883-RA protein AED:0.09 eAED:0.09 QI:613/1/1/1/0.6/0.33/6/858/390
MSRKPPPRDPGAPKRNQSAYLLYQNAMRDTFRAQNPGMTFGQLSKFTSAMYAEMHPSEKEAWVQRAEADKQRYLQELQFYQPPPGYDAKGDAIAGMLHNTSSGGKTAKGLQKDPDAPKKNMSAYLHYQNAMRDTFRAQHPAMTFGQISQHTSQMYRALGPEEKKRWEEHAARDKARYEEAMANYIPPPGYDKTGVMIASKEAGTRKYSKKEKDPNAPKRARGSFVFFTFEMRPQICQEFPGIKFTELGHVMGQRWRALTPEQKKRFEDMAENDKRRFQEEMEAYNASKEESMASSAQPKVDYAYHAGPPQTQQMYGAQNHVEHDPNYSHQYYQGHYDSNTAAAAAAHHHQYMDYYGQQGYPPSAPQAYPPQYAQHPGHQPGHPDGHQDYI